MLKLVLLKREETTAADMEKDIVENLYAWYAHNNLGVRHLQSIDVIWVDPTYSDFRSPKDLQYFHDLRNGNVDILVPYGKKQRVIKSNLITKPGCHECRVNYELLDFATFMDEDLIPYCNPDVLSDFVELLPQYVETSTGKWYNSSLNPHGNNQTNDELIKFLEGK